MPLSSPAVLLDLRRRGRSGGRQLGDLRLLLVDVLLELRLARLGVGQLVATDDAGAPAAGAPRSPTTSGRRRRNAPSRRRAVGAGAPDPAVELQPLASGALARSVCVALHVGDVIVRADSVVGPDLAVERV